MAKGARHRVDEPGSHQWRPDIDKHPRSLIEGWAAATEAVRGRATAELPCTRPRAGGARSTRCTRTAGVCTTVACKSGQGQCQSGKEFSIESSVIVTRQQGIVSMIVSCGLRAVVRGRSRTPPGHCPLRKSYPHLLCSGRDRTRRDDSYTYEYGRLESKEKTRQKRAPFPPSRDTASNLYLSRRLTRVGSFTCTHEGKAKPLGNPTNGKPTIVGARPLDAWRHATERKHQTRHGHVASMINSMKHSPLAFGRTRWHSPSSRPTPHLHELPVHSRRPPLRGPNCTQPGSIFHARRVRHANPRACNMRPRPIRLCGLPSELISG